MELGHDATDLKCKQEHDFSIEITVEDHQEGGKFMRKVTEVMCRKCGQIVQTNG